MPQDGFYVIVHQDLHLTDLDDIAAIRQEMQDVHKGGKDHNCEEKVDAEARISTMAQQSMQSKTLFAQSFGKTGGEGEMTQDDMLDDTQEE